MLPIPIGDYESLQHGLLIASCLCHCVSPSLCACFQVPSRPTSSSRCEVSQCNTERSLSLHLLLFKIQNQSRSLFNLTILVILCQFLMAQNQKSVPFNLKHSLKYKQYIRAEKNMGSEVSLFPFKVLFQHQLPGWS